MDSSEQQEVGTKNLIVLIRSVLIQFYRQRQYYIVGRSLDRGKSDSEYLIMLLSLIGANLSS